MKFVYCFFVLFSFHVQATVINSIKNGDWFNPLTWDLNRMPEATDTVKIEHYIQFDQDFTNISPGLLYVGECGIICGDGFYTGCYLVYGIVNIRKIRLNYGYSNSYQNYASTTQINVRESISIEAPSQGMSNNSVPVCVGGNCMFDCQEFPVNKTTECIASLKEKDNEMKIYPNPTNSFITIEGFKNETLMEIFDLKGIRIFTKLISPVEQIDVSSLSRGVYLITFNSNFILKKKLIID